MSREIYQKVGLIIALAIAGVSLPTSIILLTREPTVINYNYYYENNATTINTVKCERYQLTDPNFEAIAFDCVEGDKIIAVWDVNDANYLDVLLMNNVNFQLFVDGLSFTPVLSAIHTGGGFFEYEIINPNLYFTVFYANYSNAWFYYQVSHYQFS